MGDRFAAVKQRFWTGPTGRKIRRQGGSAANLVALYLLTGPDQLSTGLYISAPATAAHYTGLAEAEVVAALEVLARLGFAYYDAEEEVVWVVQMLRHQYGAELKLGDNRRPGIVKLLDRFTDSRFYQAFLWRYGDTHLPEDYVAENRGALPGSSSKASESRDITDALIAELCDLSKGLVEPLPEGLEEGVGASKAL